MQKFTFDYLNKWCQQMSGNQKLKKQLDDEVIKLEIKKKKLKEEEDNLNRRINANNKQYECLVKTGKEMNLNFSDFKGDNEIAPSLNKKFKCDHINDEKDNGKGKIDEKEDESEVDIGKLITIKCNNDFNSTI